MTTRVSTASQTDNLVQSIFQHQSSLETIREQLSSGIKVATPSDDPADAGSIVNFQNTSLRINQQQERIATATGFLSEQENVLTSAQNILDRAKEIAEEGANGTQSPDSRALLAKEVWQLRDQMVSLANTTYQGQYIYGGAAGTTAPYAASSPGYNVPTTGPDSIHYAFTNAAGSQTTRSIQASDSDQVPINSPGNAIFDNAINGMEQLGRALDGYSTNVVSGQIVPTGNVQYTFPANLAQQVGDINTALTTLTTADGTNINNAKSDVGARMARLDQINNILDSLKESTETNRSALQDTDTIAAAAQFSNMQTALQALLASGSQINNISLLNYL